MHKKKLLEGVIITGSQRAVTAAKLGRKMNYILLLINVAHGGDQLVIGDLYIQKDTQKDKWTDYCN